MVFTLLTSGYATDQALDRQIHRNYMLQVQILINQKAIEAPGAKKPW
jgi:hypothetical protein